jgi:hypothetical protein
MSNSLAAMVPLIIAKGVPVLREAAIMPKLINTDYSNDAKQKGESITIPISGTKTVSDVTPGAVPPTPADSTLTSTTITLDSWKKVDFYLTEQEAAKMLSREDYISLELAEAMRALANKVNTDVFALYKKVYGYAGTAGTTPFASTTDVLVDLGITLDNQLAPVEGRRLVLGTAAKGNALKLAAFTQYQITGDNLGNVQGKLGNRYGFEIDSTTTNPTHTAGTGASYQTTAALAAGVSTITVDTGTGTILVGDIVTFAGHTQTYTVTSALSAGSFEISPALQSAVADNGAVTLKASQTINLAFHRDAFAIAMRPQLETSMPSGTSTMIYTDPVSGIPLRVDMIPQYHQMAIEVSLLYGVGCPRPEYAARLVG